MTQTEVFTMTPPAAARLAAMGFDTFPCRPDKRPKVRWQDDPPPDGWDWAPDDLIGVRLPLGTVVLDVDSIDRFRASGLEVVMSAFSPTRRDGGLHIYYRTDGREPAQVTEGATLGYDTRVGGKGYVIAWNPDDWVPVAEWAAAPGWLYEQREPREPTARESGAPMTTRRDILSFLGHLALKGGLDADDYLALLRTKLANGGIVASDPRRPWTDDDLKVLAREAGKWEPAREVGRLILAEEAAPEDLAGMNAEDLLGLDLEPVQWRVEHLVPEGLGVIAAPPKTGKSVFAYQLAVEVAFGGDLFGLAAPKGNVLYYALEDGKRRSQARVRGMLKGRFAGIHRLELRWTSPRLGGELEKECHDWLSAHPGGLVIIDVLAKVRPPGSTKSLNAYDQDYEALAGLHKVAKFNPGSTILIVTHDRKAGSEDWMTRVTGTRGVTGAADFVLYINRPRGKELATIHVSGRDVEDSTHDVEFHVDGWRPADPLKVIGAMSPTRRTIVNWVAEHGPAWPAAIADGTGLDHGVVKNRVLDLAKEGLLVTQADRLGYRVPEAPNADE